MDSLSWWHFRKSATTTGVPGTPVQDCRANLRDIRASTPEEAQQICGPGWEHIPQPAQSPKAHRPQVCYIRGVRPIVR
jgi:hypothetical protein